MSHADVERFVEDLKNNEKLRGALAEQASGIGSIAAFARDKGYDVSAEEASAYISAQAGQELTDEQLDAIAGGKGESAGYGPGGTNAEVQAVVVATGSSVQTQAMTLSSGSVQAVIVTTG